MEQTAQTPVHELRTPTVAGVKIDRDTRTPHVLEVRVRDLGWTVRCLTCVHEENPILTDLLAALSRAVTHGGGTRKATGVSITLAADGYFLAELVRSGGTWTATCRRGPGGWGDRWAVENLPTLPVALGAWRRHAAGFSS